MMEWPGQSKPIIDRYKLNQRNQKGYLAVRDVVMLPVSCSC